MNIQQLYSKVRQAIDDYHMINENDKIAVGISGGKDSLTLLYALAGLQKFYPVSFQMIALTVDLGYEDFDLTKVRELCDQLGVEYHVVHTSIKDMLGNETCSLCARLRKGALNDKAKELGCNKVAYAHNMDDVVESMMLSLIYEGQLSTFKPVTYLDRMELEVIRPLVYVPKENVIGFRHKYALPVTKNPCPYDKDTQRTYVRELLAKMNEHAPGVKKRIMTAIIHGSRMEDWKKDTI